MKHTVITEKVGVEEHEYSHGRSESRNVYRIFCETCDTTIRSNVHYEVAGVTLLRYETEHNLEVLFERVQLLENEAGVQYPRSL